MNHVGGPPEREGGRQGEGQAGQLAKGMSGTRVFTVAFTLFIGAPSSDYEWDRKHTRLTELKDSALYLISVVPRLVRAGAPIWGNGAGNHHGQMVAWSAFPFQAVGHHLRCVRVRIVRVVEDSSGRDLEARRKGVRSSVVCDHLWEGSRSAGPSRRVDRGNRSPHRDQSSSLPRSDGGYAA